MTRKVEGEEEMEQPRRGRQNFRNMSDWRGGRDGFCMYFRQGFCRKGILCKYRHELPNFMGRGDGIRTVMDAEYIKNKVIMLSKDRNGCRILQKKMDEGDSEVVEIILNESEPYLTDMMAEPFGNYLFQKFLENVTEEWKTRILAKVCIRFQ